MSSYLVGIFGAAIGSGITNVLNISSPYRYFLIIGGSVIGYEIAERFYKK